MTAHRRARPASQWACDAHGRAAEGSGPEATARALAHLDRALACLRRHLESLEPERFLRPADRCHAAVDLLCWETTPRDGALDDDDDAGDVWEDPEIPALRTRGPHPEGREGNPPVGVGLALTRAGWPVRAWVWPGNTAAVTTITHLQDA